MIRLPIMWRSKDDIRIWIHNSLQPVQPDYFSFENLEWKQIMGFRDKNSAFCIFERKGMWVFHIQNDLYWNPYQKPTCSPCSSYKKAVENGIKFIAKLCNFNTESKIIKDVDICGIEYFSNIL
jgi:hypothetical protein